MLENLDLAPSRANLRLDSQVRPNKRGRFSALRDRNFPREIGKWQLGGLDREAAFVPGGNAGLVAETQELGEDW